MKAILDFFKWFFGKVFELNTAKMIVVILFLSFIAYIGYLAWIEKEEISVKSAEKIVDQDGQEVIAE